MEKGFYTTAQGTTPYETMLHAFYHTHDAYPYYRNDIRNALHYAFARQNPECITITQKDECIGHIALLRDRHLAEDSAFFGFLECIEDKAVFGMLWDELVLLARKRAIHKLLGPINASIWHQYRVISKTFGEEYFPSEPLTNLYYYTFLKSKHPAEEFRYHSASRKKFEIIINLTRESYGELVSGGLEIERTENPGRALALKVFAAAKHIFRENWGYTDLEFEEFLALYGTEKIENYIGSVYTAHQAEELLGFCINLRCNNTLVMKTMGVLPAMQGRGIGNALVHVIHKDAAADGISEIIYGLVKKDNKVKYFPADDVHIVREYSAFEYRI